MIPRDYSTAWRAEVPWVQDLQVEQDLAISRALLEKFSHPYLRSALAFHGGTALYKLLVARLPGEPWKGTGEGSGEPTS